LNRRVKSKGHNSSKSRKTLTRSGLRVSGFGFRVSGFGFRVSGVGFRV
jgi:hypothetical protein